MKNDEVVFLTLIAGRKQKDSILSALTEEGVNLIESLYGRGTVNAGYVQNTLGLVHEENKIVIICLMTCEKSNKVLQMLVEKFDFNKPNTGIAFTIPVNKVSF